MADCLCHVNGDLEIVYCPLHEAAPELWKAATRALEWFAGFPHQGDASVFDRATAHEVYEQLQASLTFDKAIKKAEVQS